MLSCSKRYFSQYITFFSLIVLIGLFTTVLQVTVDEDKWIQINGDYQTEVLNAYSATERTFPRLRNNISFDKTITYEDLSQKVHIISENETLRDETLVLEEDLPNKKTYSFQGYSENQLAISIHATFVNEFYLSISTDGHTWFSRRLTQNDENIIISKEDWEEANEQNTNTVFGKYIISIESSLNLGDITPDFSYKQTEEKEVWLTVKNNLNKKVMSRHVKIVNGKDRGNTFELL